MSANDCETRDRWVDDRELSQDKVDDRRGLVGLIALMSLAIPALLIRNLFPDLNPVILAGLGVTVYSAYLVVMIMGLMRQGEQKQQALEAVPVTTDKE